jgi:hypothetical protein
MNKAVLEGKIDSALQNQEQWEAEARLKKEIRFALRTGWSLAQWRGIGPLIKVAS